MRPVGQTETLARDMALWDGFSGREGEIALIGPAVTVPFESEGFFI